MRLRPPRRWFGHEIIGMIKSLRRSDPPVPLFRLLVQFSQNWDNGLIHYAAVLSVATDERHPYRLSVYVVVFDNTQATIDCMQRKQGKDCVRSDYTARLQRKVTLPRTRRYPDQGTVLKSGKSHSTITLRQGAFYEHLDCRRRTRQPNAP